MKGFGASVLGLSISAMFAVSAQAQPEPPRIDPPPPPPPMQHRVCCTVMAGTPIRIELVDEISTKEVRAGEAFAFRLAAPVIVGGRVVLRTGTPGVGEVIEAAKPGMGGKAAKLVLAAHYLRDQGMRIPLQGLQLAASGKDNSNAANAVGVSGIVLGPVGFAGLAIAGGHVVFPAGTTANARIAADTFLTPLGPASRGAMAAAAQVASAAREAEFDDGGSIYIPPPPQGQGVVVFFRKKSLMGTGQWFNVRENGAALGKLANGAYFIQAAQPGVHTYTDATEPEVKDRLRLQIDPGETYFVEGTMTHGVVMGVSDLNPSDRATFEAASQGSQARAAAVR